MRLSVANSVLRIKNFNAILRPLRPRHNSRRRSYFVPIKRQIVASGHTFSSRGLELSMRFAFIEKIVMLSFPLVLAAVAGGAHTPTNLTYWRKRV